MLRRSESDKVQLHSAFLSLSIYFQNTLSAQMLDSQPNRQSDESPLLSAEPQPFTRPFPDDVTALIIQHTLPRPRFSFKKDNLLLLNLCLVHSSWRHFAQRELFRDVVLPTSTAAVLFRKQAGRDLPKLVQTLRVGSPQSGRTSAFLAVVKSCGDALREIWLSRVGSVNMACLEGTSEHPPIFNATAVVG